MRNLPTGTVTFLFTDVEGSTRLLHELGDDYAKALAEHRRLLRKAFAEHGGVEVDTQGDAFFVAFATASDALAAAGDGQRALTQGRIRVRMGLHTGEPIVTDEGYVGLDVHRGARIAAVAHGRQVLLSERTRGALDGGFELLDLGLHRLKDLTRPEKLFQLGAERFPPVRSLNATNLPLQPTPLVGRDRELAELRALVAEARVVTVTGPGGSGKTRLALQLAADLVDEFEDGVFWVPLAPLSEPALVLATIGQTLGAKDDLVEDIEEKRMLLLLDNFEQVVEAAPALSELVSRCPNLVLLVTSRALLRIAGERDYTVEPLLEWDAVTLFRERAAVAEPIEAVAEICRRVDCLPLAIELAAARTRTLPPEELLERLEQRLPLLTGGRRDAPERQRTLRATIEWSYELLHEDAKRLFARLSVFAGSFQLKVAEAICEAELEVVEQLVEQSLVRRWGSGRLGMLETIRDFALERLEDVGELDELRRRHAVYFLELAERAEPHLRGPQQTEWLERLDAEHDNVRAAVAWSVGRDPGLAQQLAAAAWRFWHLRSYLGEGVGHVRDALGAAEPTPELRYRLLHALGQLTYYRGEPSEAASWLQQASELARGLADDAALAGSLTYLAVAAGHAGDSATARAAGDEAVVVARRTGDAWTLGLALWALGANVQLDRVEAADVEEPRRLLEESSQVLRDVGDPWALAAPLFYLGRIEQEAGDFEAAFALINEAAELLREVGDKWRLQIALSHLANVAGARGDEEGAARLAEEADSLERELGPLRAPTAPLVAPSSGP